MFSFIRTSTWLVTALSLSLVMGCKSSATVDPTPDTPSSTTTTSGSPSVVGNWTMTALTFNPAWTQQSGTNTLTFPDYMPYLKLVGETCLTDVTVTFAANGTLSTNSASLNSCNDAKNSKYFLDYLFGPESTYTETDKGVTIYGKGKLTSLDLSKTGTSRVVNLAFSLSQDLSARAIPTTYTIVLTKK